jgi:hypothetical protein
MLRENLMLIFSYFQGFDDVAQKLRFDSINAMKNFGLNGVVMLADFTNPAIDDAFVPACKAAGLNVIITPNTWDYAKINTILNANTNVIAWDCMDDANLNGLQKTLERLATLKPHIKPGIKTYITVGKGADHAVFANLAEMYHVQNYHYREGLKKWSWTAMLEARKQCKGILLHGPALIKMTPLEFGVKANRREWMLDDYVPLQYNTASAMAAICAGANGLGYYSLFEGIPEQVGKNDKYYSYILERTDLVEGYKSFHAELKKYEVYFDTGTRVPFEIENTPIVGATFTLTNGDWIRVEVNTEEYNAKYKIIDSKDLFLQSAFKQTVVGSAKVVVQDGNVNITGTNTKFTV